MLDRLFMHTRPVVVFDPANPVHRKAASTYIRTGGWGKVPMKFLLENPYLDVPTMIHARLIDYYLGLEFGKPRDPELVDTEFVAN
jgi:hypothetical protein